MKYALEQICVVAVVTENSASGTLSDAAGSLQVLHKQTPSCQSSRVIIITNSV
jgi:hypothetical protein